MKKIVYSIIGILLVTACTFIASDKGQEVLDRISEAQEKKESEGLERSVTYRTPVIEKEEKKEESQNLASLIARIEDPKDITIELVDRNGTIEIVLFNPEERLIQSVRSWFAFPPRTLKISNLDLNTVVFDLIAPNEYKADEQNGLVMIGLSSTKGVRLTQVSIGSFDYEKNSPNSVPLNCYDYGDYSDSHCVVLSKDGENLLETVEGIIIK